MLDFSVGAEHVIREIVDLIQYVESRGHVITFSYLTYVPGYSSDQKAVKDNFSPHPDHTNFIIL